MFELKALSHVQLATSINTFDASYGTESCAMSFIVNRPANEPGFYLERRSGRMIRYTIKS
jgi:ribulose-bisphosphate carboxylase small chain